MRGVNKVILIGNATRDAELRHTQSGQPVSNIRLATNRTVNGEEQTQFHTVVCWDTLAETTSRYVGAEPLQVEEHQEHRILADDDGVERRTVEIIATDVPFHGLESGPRARAYFDLAGRRCCPDFSERRPPCWQPPSWSSSSPSWQ